MQPLNGGKCAAPCYDINDYISVCIDHDVAVPTKPNQPYDRMGIGDSFHIANANADTLRCVKAQVARESRRMDGRKFIYRRKDGGIRVWRVA